MKSHSPCKTAHTPLRKSAAFPGASAVPSCIPDEPSPHVHFERDVLRCSFIVILVIAVLHYGVML